MRFAEAERLVVNGLSRGESPLLRFRLAQVYAATARRGEALAQLDLVLKAEPTNGEALRLREQLANQ